MRLADQYFPNKNVSCLNNFLEKEIYFLPLELNNDQEKKETLKSYLITFSALGPHIPPLETPTTLLATNQRHSVMRNVIQLLSFLLLIGLS